MELILIDLDTDKPSEVAKFSLTQKEVDEDFVYVVETKVANLLNVKWEHVYIEGQCESNTAMEKFVANGYSFSIKVGKHKYTVIPS